MSAATGYHVFPEDGCKRLCRTLPSGVVIPHAAAWAVRLNGQWCIYARGTDDFLVLHDGDGDDEE